MSDTGQPFIGPRNSKWADPQHTIPWRAPGEAAHKDDEKKTAILRAMREFMTDANVQQLVHKTKLSAAVVRRIAESLVEQGRLEAFDFTTYSRGNGQKVANLRHRTRSYSLPENESMELLQTWMEEDGRTT